MKKSTLFLFLLFAFVMFLFAVDSCLAQTFIQGVALVQTPTTTVTAAGTTTLTAASQTNQEFTGVTTQTVVLPDTTTLQKGRQFYIMNRSTGAVTVNFNGGTQAAILPPGTVTGSQAVFLVINNSTAIGTWDVSSINTTDVTLTAFGSAPNANGLTLAGQALNMQPASASQPGGMSITTQTLAGNKTWSGTNEFDANLYMNGTFGLGAWFDATNELLLDYVHGTTSIDLQGRCLNNGTTCKIDYSGVLGQFNNGMRLTSDDGGSRIEQHITNGGSSYILYWPPSQGAANQFLVNDGAGNTSWLTFSLSNIAGSVSAAQMPALTNDVTSTAGTVATTVAKIQGTTVSGTTGTGNVVFSSAPTMSNPVVGTQASSDNSTKAASTAYVQTALAQLNPAAAVFAGSVANVAGTYLNLVGGVCVGDTFTTTATTAFALDGTSPAVGARVLFKDQTSSFQDGVWTLTTQAVGGVSGAVLTRALDDDSSSDFNSGQIIPIQSGTVNAGASWYRSTSTNTTCNSDAQTWTQFQKASSAYLQAANNLSDVTTKATAFNNISPMTTGGDIIYGGASGAGTRLANGSSGQFLQSQGGTSAPIWSAPTITLIPPIAEAFKTSGGPNTYNINYAFICGSCSATAAATYTNNAVTFTVFKTVSSANIVYLSGSAAPTATGTLTKTGGTGDATITFTSEASPISLEIMTVGAGGGGTGNGSAVSAAGGNGSQSNFQTSGSSTLVSAIGGSGGAAGSTTGGGAGGTAGTVNAPALELINLQGGSGGGSGVEPSANVGNMNGPFGGASGCGGPGGGSNSANASGGNAPPNSGGGGGGAGTGANVSWFSGSSGGGGGCSVAILPGPLAAQYKVTIGAKGTGGGAGTGGSGNGGDGSDGLVTVKSSYQ